MLFREKVPIWALIVYGIVSVSAYGSEEKLNLKGRYHIELGQGFNSRINTLVSKPLEGESRTVKSGAMRFEITEDLTVEKVLSTLNFEAEANITGLKGDLDFAMENSSDAKSYAFMVRVYDEGVTECFKGDPVLKRSYLDALKNRKSEDIVELLGDSWVCGIHREAEFQAYFKITFASSKDKTTFKGSFDSGSFFAGGKTARAGLGTARDRLLASAKLSCKVRQLGGDEHEILKLSEALKDVDIENIDGVMDNITKIKQYIATEFKEQISDPSNLVPAKFSVSPFPEVLSPSLAGFNKAIRIVSRKMAEKRSELTRGFVRESKAYRCAMLKINSDSSQISPMVKSQLRDVAEKAYRNRQNYEKALETFLKDQSLNVDLTVEIEQYDRSLLDVAVLMKSPIKPLSLHEHVRLGDELAVKKMLSIGVDINYQDPETGKTAAHIAAEQGHVSLLQLLDEHGADFRIRDGEHTNVYTSALLCPNKAMHRYIYLKTD